jgi:hypothetical protein
MAEFIDKETGDEVEGYTSEEVEQKLEAERAKIEEEKTVELEQIAKEHEEEKKSLEQLIEEKDKEIEKTGSKDYNWKKLREQKDALEQKLAERDKAFDEKIEGVKKEIVGDKVEREISKLVEDDPEMAKKVRFYYDNFKGEPKDDKEFKERIKNASLLAGVGGSAGSVASVAGSGVGLPPMAKKPVEGKLSDEAKEMAKKNMGFTEEELKNL